MRGILERWIYISIHAPHARSDHHGGRQEGPADGISIHAPHARSDALRASCSAFIRNFNPRSSCEERPLFTARRRAAALHFNPRSSCEERLSFATRKDCPGYFNPRSSCEERLQHVGTWKFESAFQSTLLMRGATVSILGIDLPDFIIYFSRTYPFSPKMPTSRHLSCKLHFLCDGTSHFGDL